jgi:hypothetical protein
MPPESQAYILRGWREGEKKRKKKEKRTPFILALEGLAWCADLENGILWQQGIIARRLRHIYGDLSEPSWWNCMGSS